MVLLRREEGNGGEWGENVVGGMANTGRAIIAGLEPNFKYKLQTLKKPPMARK